MKVLALENYAVSALARLRADARFEFVSQVEDAEALLIRSRTRVDKDFLNKAKSLRCVITATSGFDHIDWRECEARGVTAAHSPESNGRSTAELTLALMLAAERQLPTAIKNVRGNLWREGLQRPHGLSGQTLAIIGLGRIGQRVARLARLLEMTVVAHDAYVDQTVFQLHGAERLSFIEALRAADIVTLHVPLTKETRHLLNQPTFKEMNEGAILINTCRGPVVDENDLMVALDEGTIRGAAMDVIEREPPPAGHRLLTHPKLLLTPHIGAFTDSAWESASHEAVDQLIAFSGGAKPANALPLRVPWFAATL